MKKYLLLSFLVLSFLLGAATLATDTTDDSTLLIQPNVTSITLNDADSTGKISWSVVGTSAQGFKIVWSKNPHPTYPSRPGDEYYYASDPNAKSYTLTDFNGAGTYYARVCEYLGDKCGVYSNEIDLVLGETEKKIACTLEYAPVCGANGKTYANKCQANAADVVVKYSGECKTTTAAVAFIKLSLSDENSVKWVSEGRSLQGFKVVWSKTSGPTYPNRSGDRYHYYSDPGTERDRLEAFDGAGVYYVRVCEYLGGKCGVYSNEVRIELKDKTENGKTNTRPSVTTIKLRGEANKISWAADGYAASGFKVVWSKNAHPTYPTRSGDQYHYLSSPSANSDFITPFDGNGQYYVRVCEYINGECEIYSNEIDVIMNNAEDKGVKQIETIRENASELYNNKIDALLAEINELKNVVREQQVQIDHLMRLKDGLAQAINSAVETAITNFIAYGVDENSKNLGEGERAAVMYSFKAAFNKLPETESELEDAIKIANGRWPSLVSDDAETKAKEQFKKIYLRDADMNNPHDAAAVKIMAYGLRQQAQNRNLNSEATALKFFKAIFKKLPQTTEEWNALQAITYSGATR